jgi:serine/threonine-protein kinase
MDPGSLIRFMHEARLHSRLVHPNICQIFDVDSSENAPRIAMQLVRGPTLADAGEDLTVDEVVQIMAQVADAVHAAHRLKLIHRDLKPSNILLDPNSEGGWIPYVCDFGLAMELDEPTMTAPQWVNGTPAYMAPEQLRGERSLIGPPTDVFALGGTLYFALHGVPPQGPPGPEPALGERREVPRDLDRIARKCMDPDPELRYPTAAAFAEDLWRFRNGDPIHARPAGALERHWRRWHRVWKRASAAALAAAILGAGLLLGQRQLTAAERRRADWERFFVLEAAAMERDLSLEKALPLHDLRPAYAQLRTRLKELAARLPTRGADAQGPGHFALGQGRFLLGDWQGARQELEQAGTSGFQGPEVAGLLAQALAAIEDRTEHEAAFTSGTASPGPALAQVETLLRRSRGLGAGSGEYGEALVAFLRQDYARAVERAHAAMVALPWQSGPPVMASLSLTALGRQGFEASDPLLAEARYGEAMEVAEEGLERSPGEESVHHAYLLAARGLASLQLGRGELAIGTLDNLQQACDKALRVNPGHPDLQDDRLALGILKAKRLADLGADPGPELDAALAFMAAWTREPLSPALRADRMLLHWLRAELAFRQGADPGPALAQALRDPGHTLFLGRDYLGEILNFKARVEASQGADPRPTLDQAMARMDPLLGPGAPQSLCETAAQTWLIRSQWEAAHGLDPRMSTQRFRELSDRGQGRHPKPLAAALPSI